MLGSRGIHGFCSPLLVPHFPGIHSHVFPVVALMAELQLA